MGVLASGSFQTSFLFLSRALCQARGPRVCLGGDGFTNPGPGRRPSTHDPDLCTGSEGHVQNPGEETGGLTRSLLSRCASCPGGPGTHGDTSVRPKPTEDGCSYPSTLQTPTTGTAPSEALGVLAGARCRGEATQPVRSPQPEASIRQRTRWRRGAVGVGAVLSREAGERAGSPGCSPAPSRFPNYL